MISYGELQIFILLNIYILQWGRSLNRKGVGGLSPRSGMRYVLMVSNTKKIKHVWCRLIPTHNVLVIDIRHTLTYLF